MAAGSEGETAVAAVCDGSATDAADDKTCEEIAVLSVKQAGAVHQNKVQIAALQGAIEAITQTGQLKVVQHMERYVSTLKRRQLALSSETPVVADAFKRQRLAEEQEFRDKTLMIKQTKELRKNAQTAVAAKQTALAAFAKAKRAQEDLETKHACSAAIKTFSMETLGANDSKAGGPRARRDRFEVLDRLARLGADLSPFHDFEWWKHAWDGAMVEEHKGKWAETFAGWMQDVINSSETNAFSTFMHNETHRVFRNRYKKVLAVPGIK